MNALYRISISSITKNIRRDLTSSFESEKDLLQEMQENHGFITDPGPADAQVNQMENNNTKEELKTQIKSSFQSEGTLNMSQAPDEKKLQSSSGDLSQYKPVPIAITQEFGSFTHVRIHLLPI